MLVCLAAASAGFSNPSFARTDQASTEEAETEKAPATLRLDYYHTGGKGEEIWSFDRLVVEPTPWPGNPDRPIDDTLLGKYRFLVREVESGRLLYSRGFASIYGEWETTAEARALHRTFHESLRFPLPEKVVKVTVEKRATAADPSQIPGFVEAWSLEVDPNNLFVDRTWASDGIGTDRDRPGRLRAIPIHGSRDPAHALDLLFLGDGYTAEECAHFEERSKHLAEALFRYSPFRERRHEINIWGLCPPADASGVSRPSTGIHRRSPVGTTYDAFGSERYVLTFDNRAFRDIASWAPYDVVEILVNNEVYGGGGIFGQFATVAADNDWADYLFVHEFGHHLAALADEYYTSSVAYELGTERAEPWETNVTAHPTADQLKWRDLVTPGTPLPTPWPKAEFERLSSEIQERRTRIRAENRPEAEMSALFDEERSLESELLGPPETVGAFEGANYAAQGYYRSQVDCVMFSRNDVPFCRLCQKGIETILDLYTKGPDGSESGGKSGPSAATDNGR